MVAITELTKLKKTAKTVKKEEQAEENDDTINHLIWVVCKTNDYSHLKEMVRT